MTRRQIINEAPPPCECPYYGEPIHDEDPVRFHLESGFQEDDFVGFHAHRNTRCPRHPTRRSRPIMTPSSSSSDGDRPLSPAINEQEAAPAASRTRLTGPRTPLQRHRTPPPPQPHPRWVGTPMRSLSRNDRLDGLHRSFPSNDDQWDFANPTIMRATSDPVDTRHHHQRPGMGHVRAQRSERDLDNRLSHRRTHHTGAEQIPRGIAVNERSKPKPRVWQTLYSGSQQPNVARMTGSAPATSLTDRTRAQPLGGGSCSDSSSTLTELDDQEPTISHSQRVTDENVTETRLVVQKRLDEIEREAAGHADGMRKLVVEKSSLLLELGHLRFEECKKR